MSAKQQGEQGANEQSTQQRPAGSSNRGFASMDPERQRAIASQGGRAAHEKGTAHQFTPEEAREAGSKGGRVAHERGTAHQFDSEEARAAGRKGGLASGSRQQAAAQESPPQASQPSQPEEGSADE